MGDETSDPRPAVPLTLREYLADRDIPCEQCGYNLRGTQGVFCPECGAVIPRPPSEHIARKQMDPAAMKLWCPECDYVVTGINAQRCPECGHGDLARFNGEKPPAPRRRFFRPRGVPAPLWLNAVFGAVVLLGYGVTIVMRTASRGRAPSIDELAVLIFGAGPPLLIATLWVAGRAPIRNWNEHHRRAAAGLGFLMGLSWIYAIILLR